MLIVLLVLLMATVAFADNERPDRLIQEKTPALINPEPPLEFSREGGEDVFSAVPIGAMPFNDIGYTCDNLDDYEESCFFSASDAPDVVYSYTPLVDETLFIDLCLSDYDTKVFVYDSVFTVMGCNDDFWYDPPCATYSSYLELILPAGMTYFIVVDGYGGGCGNYDLAITAEPYIPPPPCIEVVCDENAQPEGESPLYPDYDDTLNGGCNSTPNVFQTLNWIDEDSGCMHLSGVSGWYPYGGGDYRDTDWYEIIAAGTEITVKIETDNETTLTRCMMTDANPACTGYAYSFQTSEIEGCTEYEWTVATTPGATYWVFVAPAAWLTGVTDEFDYCLEICGNAYDIIGNEDQSWGAVKSLYK